MRTWLVGQYSRPDSRDQWRLCDWRSSIYSVSMGLGPSCAIWKAPTDVDGRSVCDAGSGSMDT